MKINDKLNCIQMNLNAPKSQYNSFGKYPYRNCEDILEALKEHIGGCVVTLSDEIKMIGDRVYVHATATISDGSDSISVSAYAREALTKKGMDESQITGAASSYARKYALNGLFLIDDNKDADSQNGTTGNANALTDIDKQWIAAIESGSAKLTDIENSQDRARVEKELNK